MWMLCVWWVLLGTLGTGSAQLFFESVPFLEINYCNGPHVILPCVVTNLKDHDKNSMFLSWQYQGNHFFTYDGASGNITKNSSFDTATFLNRSMVPYGIASLNISTNQAALGNYTCEVVEGNREGKTRVELITSSQIGHAVLCPLPPTPSTGDLLTQEFLFETLKEFRQEIKQLLSDLYDKLDAKIAQTREDTIRVMTVMTGYVSEMEDKLELLEKTNSNLTSKIQTLQQEVENAQKQLVMINYNKTAFAIRVRGLREKEQENLKQTFFEAFRRSVGSPGFNFDWQIQKIYRQNSCVAKQRQLPRDIIIYFTTRESRNAIIQKFYNNRLRIDGQDLIVFKEIPSQILRARRDYTFLTEKLRDSQIQYKWEVPSGITVTFENQKYRLNSVCEARDFYYKILKAGLPDSPGLGERQGEGEDK